MAVNLSAVGSPGNPLEVAASRKGHWLGNQPSLGHSSKTFKKGAVVFAADFLGAQGSPKSRNRQCRGDDTRWEETLFVVSVASTIAVEWIWLDERCTTVLWFISQETNCCACMRNTALHKPHIR